MMSMKPFLPSFSTPIPSRQALSMQSQFEKLLSWVESGEFSRVKGYLKIHTGFDINFERLISRETLLLASVRAGDENLVQFLIQYGADVNAKDQYGFTALSLSLLKYENIPVAKVLLAAPGIDIGADAMLQILFWDKYIKAARAFIEIAGDRLTSFKILRLLFETITTNGRNHIALMLLNNTTRPLTDHQIIQGLITAVQYQNTFLVKPFAQRCGNINFLLKDDYSLLMYAITLTENKEGQKLQAAVQVVFTLLKAPKINLDIVSTDRMKTALMIATKHKLTAVVKKLLEKGVFKDFRNALGISPLMMASFIGHKGIVSLLLEANADINFATSKGMTALSVAVREVHEEIITLLVKQGGDYSFVSGKEIDPKALAAIETGKLSRRKVMPKEILSPTVLDLVGSY